MHILKDADEGGQLDSAKSYQDIDIARVEEEL